ncbi:MAG TPA: ABC transporter ATP-binding protein [Acidimicrobiales bacterium]|nr:ABC transporter ATP-binding protein [Acidimicrobiales bacterium]
MSGEAVLTVEDLTVRVGRTAAVEGVGFTIEAGTRVGLIGESGSGKTLTALSVMGLLAEGLSASGAVRHHGRELLGLTEAEMCQVRGDTITMVFQEPMTALNPVMKIGRQVAESLRIHRGASRAEALERAADLLEQVRLPDARSRLEAYPHQLSGGQRQRVMIALALACGPELIIADEPTTALDVTVQAQILVLLRDLVTETGASLLLITHDLAVVSNVCEEVLVMYGGRIVESGPTGEVFSDPRHPYTAGLLAAVPEIELGVERARRLPTIPGSVPGLGRFPSGCVFRNRCARADAECEQEPPSETIAPGRSVACFHRLRPGEAAEILGVPVAAPGYETGAGS